LFQNYPNPFNPSTTVAFSVPFETPVRIEIFNLLGQSVATLIDGRQKPGNHRVTWHAGGQPSGLYFCRLLAGTHLEVRKLSLMR
jgi:hypothetical protein